MLGGTPGVSDKRRPLLPVHGLDGIWRMLPEHHAQALTGQPSARSGGSEARHEHHQHHQHHQHHGQPKGPEDRTGGDLAAMRPSRGEAKHQEQQKMQKALEGQGDGSPHSVTTRPTLLGAAPPGRAQPAKGASRPAAAGRLERLLESAAVMAESKTPLLAAALRLLAPVAAPLGDGLLVIGRGYVAACTWLYRICSKTPYELQAATGLVLCFFGGTFVAIFAAVEAFRKMGLERLQAEVRYIVDQAALVQAASALDDLKDEDADGVADVDQMDAKQLARQKLHVAMMSIEDPKRLESAVSYLWGACLGAIATLKIQFAQTVAFALAFSEMLKLPVLRILAPALCSLLGPELQHWVETIVEVLLKAVLILAVWFLAKAQGAVYAGLRGGTMFGVAFVKILEERGILQRLYAKPWDPNNSYLDEVLGFSVAALGFYWQFHSSFMVPFPFSWLLWPLTALETFLELQISWQ